MEGGIRSASSGRLLRRVAVCNQVVVVYVRGAHPSVMQAKSIRLRLRICDSSTILIRKGAREGHTFSSVCAPQVVIDGSGVASRIGK